MKAANALLTAVYLAAAYASGNAWHISNAQEHAEAADSPAFDADATRHALKSLADLLHEGTTLEQ